MVFAVSRLEINPLIPPLVALVFSSFTSMGGISGAFLLLPFQVSLLNFTSPSVSPTNLVFNIVAIPSGVYRYIREGRMNWPLTAVVVFGTLPGIWIGALIRLNWMLNPRNFKLFVGVVLLYIGLRILYEQTPAALRKQAKILEFEAKVHQRLLKVMNEARPPIGRGLPSDARIKTISWSSSRVEYQFLGETFSFNPTVVSLVALIVGLIGGAYGIGGGAIIAPFVVATFGLPVYTVAGAALTGTFITSLSGVAAYYMLAPFYPGLGVAPDLSLGVLFGIGGFLGMYVGARLQKFIPANRIRFGLGIVMSALAVKYIIGFFL